MVNQHRQVWGRNVTGAVPAAHSRHVPGGTLFLSLVEHDQQPNYVGKPEDPANHTDRLPPLSRIPLLNITYWNSYFSCSLNDRCSHGSKWWWSLKPMSKSGVLAGWYFASYTYLGGVVDFTEWRMNYSKPLAFCDSWGSHTWLLNTISSWVIIITDNTHKDHQAITATILDAMNCPFKQHGRNNRMTVFDKINL